MSVFEFFTGTISIPNPAKCPDPTPDAVSQFRAVLASAKTSSDAAVTAAVDKITKDKTLTPYEKVQQVNQLIYPISDIVRDTYKNVLGTDVIGACRAGLDAAAARFSDASGAIAANAADTDVASAAALKKVGEVSQIITDQNARIAAFKKYLADVRAGYMSQLQQIEMDSEVQREAIIAAYTDKLDRVQAIYARNIADAAAAMVSLQTYADNIAAAIRSNMSAYGDQLQLRNEQQQSAMSLQHAREIREKLVAVRGENAAIGRTWHGVEGAFRTADAKSAKSRVWMTRLRFANRVLVAVYAVVFCIFVYFVFTRLESVPPPYKAGALCLVAGMPRWAPYAEIAVFNMGRLMRAIVLGVPYVAAPYEVVVPTFRIYG
jgi:hypothetical protein